MTSLEQNRILKTNDAAKYLRVSRSSLANWIRQGLLAGGATPGGHHRFDVDELDRFAQKMGIGVDSSILISDMASSEVVRILLVDDDADFREFVRETLDIFDGFELREAADGLAAAMAIGSWRPHLVFLDVRMPNMNGLDFCAELRRNYPDGDLRVIMASAYLSQDVRARLAELKVDIILEKPVRIEKLSAAVQQLTHIRLKA